MITEKLKERMEFYEFKKVCELPIPVKITPNPDYKPQPVEEVVVTRNRKVSARVLNSNPGLQQLVEDISGLCPHPVIFPQTKTNPTGYVLAKLNIFQILDLDRREYVGEIDDDTPINPFR
jgi:hypothetical protein